MSIKDRTSVDTEHAYKISVYGYRSTCCAEGMIAGTPYRAGYSLQRPNALVHLVLCQACRLFTTFLILKDCSPIYIKS